MCLILMVVGAMLFMEAIREGRSDAKNTYMTDYKIRLWPMSRSVTLTW
jgi:hypothetical protein